MTLRTAVLGPREQALLVILLFVLMLGMGATLTLQSMRAVASRPRAMLVGLVSQFGWMPLLGYALARAFDLAPAAAIGLVVVGSCPGGSTSNMYTYFAKGDVALSIAMTTLTTVSALLIMPALLLVYAAPFTSATLQIPYANVLQALLFMLVPVGLGVLLRSLKPALAKRAERMGSRAGALVIVLLSASLLVHNRSGFLEMSTGEWLGALALGGGGVALGHFTALLSRLTSAERRTIAIEAGIQNSALALTIIVTSFPAEAALAMTRVVLAYALSATLSVAAAALAYRAEATRGAGETSPLSRLPERL